MTQKEQARRMALRDRISEVLQSSLPIGVWSDRLVDDLVRHVEEVLMESPEPETGDLWWNTKNNRLYVIVSGVSQNMTNNTEQTQVITVSYTSVDGTGPIFHRAKSEFIGKRENGEPFFRLAAKAQKKVTLTIE